MRIHVIYSSDVTVTDMFCGCGGSSYGAQKVKGVRILRAINHWARAIETHNVNFPEVDHVLSDINDTNPLNFERTDILIASPSCTAHSLAKGRKKDQPSPQIELPWDEDEYGAPLPLSAEERSRCTMWDPLKWARVHLYNYVILENVVDVRAWKYYQLWLQAWRDLDYEFEVCYANSQFFHPTPQSRDRWYFIAWRKGNTAPQLDFRPQAYCPRCEQLVAAIQSWKMPGKAHGRYGPYRQYLYRCPRCTEVVSPFYYAAANAIDWSLPTPRIGDRKKALKPKTMKRVQTGLDRFRGQQPFTVHLNKSTDRFTPVVNEPFRTQTADNGQALVTPFLLHTSHAAGSDQNWVYSMDGALPTQTARQDMAMVTPPRVCDLKGDGLSGDADVSPPLAQHPSPDDTISVLPNAGLLDLLAEYRNRDITSPH